MAALGLSDSMSIGKMIELVRIGVAAFGEGATVAEM